MKTYTIFYAGLLYAEHEVDEWPGAHSLPEGCYLLMTKLHSADWYVKQHGSLSPINLADVPKELRVLTLLLN